MLGLDVSSGIVDRLDNLFVVLLYFGCFLLWMLMANRTLLAAWYSYRQMSL